MIESLLSLVMYACAPTQNPGKCEQIIYACAERRIVVDHEQTFKAVQKCWLIAESGEIYE